MDDHQELPTISLAVALRYDEDEMHAAPRVTAKGNDDIAQRILDIARRHQIPIQENKELVRLLSQVELGEQIPEALYLTVAEVIAFAYLLKGKVPKSYQQP